MRRMACWFGIVLVLLAANAAGQVSGQPRQDRVNRLDGGYLAYYHWPGKGPNLLLIPGSWSEYSQFDAIRKHLDPNLNLVIVELPGHGRSLPPTLNGSIPLFASDVLRVPDALGWKRWFAGGHSIGGMVAIELAGQRPKQLAGVISIEGWAHHLVAREAFGGQIRITLSEEQRQMREKARAKTLDRLSREERASFGSIWTKWDGLPILQKTTVPILELWGDRKRSRQPSRREMRIPERENIKLRWIADAGHSLPLERPKEVATAINGFLAMEACTTD